MSIVKIVCLYLHLSSSSGLVPHSSKSVSRDNLSLDDSVLVCFRCHRLYLTNLSSPVAIGIQQSKACYKRSFIMLVSKLLILHAFSCLEVDSGDCIVGSLANPLLLIFEKLFVCLSFMLANLRCLFSPNNESFPYTLRLCMFLSVTDRIAFWLTSELLISIF